MSDETRETRIKRLRMRAWRRGMREVDLILGPFADASLPGMSDAAIDGFEDLLGENDQEIYGWISGTDQVPAAHGDLVKRIIESISARDPI